MVHLFSSCLWANWYYRNTQVQNRLHVLRRQMGDPVHSFNGKFQEILHISEKIQARDVLML